jgi:hypothetical protein
MNLSQTAAAIPDITFLLLVEAKYQSKERYYCSYVSLAYKAIHSTCRCIASPHVCLNLCPSRSTDDRWIEPGKHDTAMIEPIDNKFAPLLLAEEHCSDAERRSCRKIQRGIVSQTWQQPLPELNATEIENPIVPRAWPCNTFQPTRRPMKSELMLSIVCVALTMLNANLCRYHW